MIDDYIRSAIDESGYYRTEIDATKSMYAAGRSRLVRATEREVSDGRGVYWYEMYSFPPVSDEDRSALADEMRKDLASRNWAEKYGIVGHANEPTPSVKMIAAARSLGVLA